VHGRQAVLTLWENIEFSAALLKNRINKISAPDKKNERAER
jgi:hypothetical protein